jgi:hypothetical protein
MIRLTPSPTFKARVKFTVPGAEDPALVEFEFRHKAPQALSAWWEASKDRPTADVLYEVIAGWSGVIDETGADVPFTADALAVFLAGHGPRPRELLGAYLRELTESRQKNL